MLKTALKALVLGATLIGAGAPAAFAQEQRGEPMYERYYYDDPEMTEQVGYNRDECYYFGVGGGPHQGRYGPYVQEYVIAYCDRGVLYPI